MDDRFLVVLAIVALGVDQIMVALYPASRLAKLSYWWRLPSKTDPSVVERASFLALGVTLLLVGAYVFQLISR
jgi:hypothetical protein